MVRHTDAEVSSFTKELQLIRMDGINSFAYQILPAISIEKGVVFQKFIFFNQQLSYAAQMLIDAYKTSYDGNNNDDKLVLWRRCAYLFSAIVQYNSFYDYIYQMLYFHLSMYKKYPKTKNKFLTKDINSKNDVIEISKKVNNSLITVINNYLKKDNSLLALAQNLSNYQTKTKHLRELANDIKHRAGVSVDGIYLERKVSAKAKNQNSGIESSYEIVKPEIIIIEDEINYLKEVHQELLSIIKQLYGIFELPKLS